MKVTIIKGEKCDQLVLRRGDGSEAVSRFPKKGPVPHDATHFFVEQALGLTHGFWGMVATGHHPEDVAEIAKSGGHASAKRACIPDADIVELLQAERLVECFEASLWDGRTDPALLREVAATACASSHVNMPDLSDEAISLIAAQVSELAAEWSATAIGHDRIFEWPNV